jgi:hypothetical protein
MIVTIIDVNQRYVLQTQSFSNVITFRLPNGLEVAAVVTDSALQAVLTAAQGQPVQAVSVREEAPLPTNVSRLPTPFKPPPRVADPTQNPFLATEDFEAGPMETPVPPSPEDQFEHHVEEGLVEWKLLPDTQLPPQVRHIMEMSQLPAMMTIADLDQLKLEITSRLAKRPQAGQVDWDSGPRRRVESTPRRTVSMDEAGNPIPPGGILEMREARDARDPGEVREEEDAQQA